MNLLDHSGLDWDLLQHYDFDRERFVQQASAAAGGRARTEDVFVHGNVVPAPGVRDVDFESSEGRAARRSGEAALRRGEVGLVVLNGGMATRFGGVVKGAVEVFDGKSFIGLKCEDALRLRSRLGRVPPVVLMNSFATDVATRKHLEQYDYFGLPGQAVRSFCQSISIRLQPDGQLFLGRDGLPSYYTPGHGDFFRAIRASGLLGELREQGVRQLVFSNIDNLGATLDPTLIGLHRNAGWEMTLEVTQRRRDAGGAWDAGGAPVLVDGKLRVVEGFRFPAGVQERLPDFQANNMIFDTAAIDRHIPLEYYPVIKRVDGLAALQFEAITCEASGATDENGTPLFKLGLLRVPRDGPRGRFFPIKSPEDLAQSRDSLRGRLEAGWQLRDREAE
jgi:UTP--glucose-1-phosphate uridylyltransferase